MVHISQIPTTQITVFVCVSIPSPKKNCQDCFSGQTSFTSIEIF